MNMSMFYGTTPAIFEKARLLRNNETPAERLLWKKLSQNQLSGFRFKRQHPIASYVVDFYCHKAKLVIEIDEPYHNKTNQKELDLSRSRYLESLGLTVVRFTDSEVLSKLDSVLSKISKLLPTS